MKTVVLTGEARPDLLREETLVDVFRATAARVGSKTALTLIGTGRALSYAELDAQSDRVAAALIARGAKPGDFVGLWLKRSIDLHVALLGILKAGAAYIPFDAEAPADRVASCLADCGAHILVSHEPMAADVAKVGQAGVMLSTLLGEGAKLPAPAPVIKPDSPAYAIYTSGSTGKPKGIVIHHRSICHYLRAGNAMLGFAESDVVLQQASVAFDLSLEEIFIPYLVGATLKVATAEVLKQSDRLPELLEKEGITVIDTVPTLLSMFDRDVPGLRLIILGGEACPSAIVERFARQGRRLFNTYGPTETTVVATGTELKPGESVTIGGPIANHTAYVATEDLKPVGPGEVGELIVGGPGVAQGYINLPEMTARKFIANPFESPTGADPILYRTGDAVSIDEAGRIRFHGRIDDQVKIRGYRIELGEIEALIAAEPGVKTAAVAVGQHAAAGDVLVAHVVPTGSGFDKDAVRKSLAAKVPPYMVPPIWQMHEDLPKLASGKVDRKTLAKLPITISVQAGEQEQPLSPTEEALLKAAKDVMGMPVIPFTADFFSDLAGNSLIAARFVSEVRKIPALAGIALQDVYNGRTLRKMAALLDERNPTGGATVTDLSFEPPPFRRRFLCGLAQAAALPFIIAIVTAQWIGLLLSSMYLVREDSAIWWDILVLSSVYLCLNLGAKVLIVALKWLLIGRIKPGVYPLWGSYYFKIWLLQRIMHLTTHKFLQGTPLMRIYLRALGAKIGRDAIIHEFEDGAIDLLSIGARTSTGTKVRFNNVEVVGNQVIVGRIDIGPDVQIGNACTFGPNVVVGEGARIGDMTAITGGTVVKPWEIWDGSPGRLVGHVDPASLPPHPVISETQRVLQTIAYFFAFNLVTMIGLLPIFPAFYLVSYLDFLTTGTQSSVIPWAKVPLLAWPAAFLLIVASMGVVIALRWLVLPRVEPGRYSIFSFFYYRKWIVSLTTETMLETLNSLYATVFMRNWYRLMGCKVGVGTEISSNFAGRYDLIDLGSNNFLGDETIFGDEEIHRGWMTLKRVKTGDRCFFGNLSVVPGGSQIDDDALLGVKSRMPESLHIKSGETWFGCPAIPMPNREKIALGLGATYQPPKYMRYARMLFEALHTSLPTAALISCAYITADVMAAPIDNGWWWTATGYFLLAGILVSLAMFFMSVIIKWSMMGIYRPLMKPMWSWWAMRTEAVAVLYGGLSSKVLLDYLRGTPFLPMLLRLYGTKIGKGVWLNSADLTEFDCVSIGDYAVLNMHCSPQTHLYEDRVMKVGRIEIGKGVTIGTSAIILYDTKIGDYAQIKPLTVVMKGEFIPPNTAWAGAPAQRVVIAPSSTPGGGEAAQPAKTLVPA